MRQILFWVTFFSLITLSSCQKDTKLKLPEYSEKYLFTLSFLQTNMYGIVIGRDNKIIKNVVIVVTDRVTTKEYQFTSKYLHSNYVSQDSFNAVEGRTYDVAVIIENDTINTHLTFPEKIKNTSLKLIYDPANIQHYPFVQLDRGSDRQFLYTFTLPDYSPRRNVGFDQTDLSDYLKPEENGKIYRSFFQSKPTYEFTSLNGLVHNSYYCAKEYEADYKIMQSYLKKDNQSFTIIPFNLKGNLTTKISRGFIIPFNAESNFLKYDNVFPTITKVKVKNKSDLPIDLQDGNIALKSVIYFGDYNVSKLNPFFVEGNNILISKYGLTDYYRLFQSDFGITPPPKNLFPVKTEFIFEDTLTKKQYRASADLEYYDAPKELTITIDY